MATWHINADEPDLYSFLGGDDLFPPDLDPPFRSSDRDPIVVGLDLDDRSPEPLTFNITRTGADSLLFTWRSRTNTTYDLLYVSEAVPDPATGVIEDWIPVEGGQGIPATPPQNVFVLDGVLSKDPFRLFYLEEFPDP